MAKVISKFIYVLGPTAVGKSQFSMGLSEALSALWDSSSSSSSSSSWPIINTDSLQVYKSLDIGTAKPSLKDRQRLPHYLFDYIQGPKTLTAAQYIKDVLNVIQENKITQALFVGGSGFYIQALEKGLYPILPLSSEVQERVKKRIQSEGYEALYQWILKKDPDYAQKISANDHYRIKRAVEIMTNLNGVSITELKKKMALQSCSPLPEHRSLKIGFRMKKEDLLLRVTARTEQMINEGLIDEVRLLMTSDFSNSWAPLKSVGYKQVQDYLLHDQSLVELKENIILATMQLIKKQMTWLKRDQDILWFEPHESALAMDKAIAWSKLT